MTDARTGTTTYGYNNADQATTVTTPVPGGGYSAQTTTTSFNTLLQAWKTTLPDGASVTNEFHLAGDLKKQSGSRIFPVEYTYDPQGRMKTMKTWQSYSTPTNQWVYYGYRGFPLRKEVLNYPYYPIVESTNTYKPSGRLATRTDGRGIAATYDYNAAGDLEAVSYSDGVTPQRFYSYDRRGRQVNCNLNGVVTETVLGEAGQVLSEKTGVRSVNYGYDGYLRRTNLAVTINGAEVYRVGYGYDTASRLSSVSDGTYGVSYGYLTNSPLVEAVGFKQNSTVRMTATKQFDNLNRLKQISHGALWSYAYGYNNANQRTTVTWNDGSYWSFGYDALGQVSSGKRYWAGGTPVAGQQFEYGFDPIGNRTWTKAGGDSAGSNLRMFDYGYGLNVLNQSLGRSVPGALDVMGMANGSASVTVNGQGAYRRNEYYQALVSVNNASGPVWQSVSVNASLEGSSQGQSGSVFLPRTPESFVYDGAGNLGSDGRWTNTWNGANQLVKSEAKSDVPAAAKRKVEFEYDHLGRRTAKNVYDWDSVVNAYVLGLQRKFVYDGWNLLVELDGNTNVIQRYVWGLDLSGSMQGAGGVGGLVAVKPAGGAAHFAAHDGNGNVMGLVDASTGTTSANYEYGPFGEPIRVTGALGRANPFRWSTKFTDDETDLVYYGYRYYTASTGRWLSRDPIGEQGGKNLYGYVGNTPVNGIDPLGMFTLTELDVLEDIVVNITMLAAPLRSQNITLKVPDCAIYFYYGHNFRGNFAKTGFQHVKTITAAGDAKLSRAAVATCFARPIPNVIPFSGFNYDDFDPGEEGSLRGTALLEMWRFVRNNWTSEAAKICATCKCKEVTLHWEKVGKAEGLLNLTPQDAKIKCPGK